MYDDIYIYVPQPRVPLSPDTKMRSSETRVYSFFFFIAGHEDEEK